ncbi:hypothetical protein [Gordonia humi]|uniref:Uncharacterized protein n=1 Tax=Gordonia humi TaxID=686429 RepID=A0A840EZ84_9ACTN|nr:hypothetical protein [Gordonia humi]MBB4135563.1 hypothetical protein [Gordonia humi]
MSADPITRIAAGAADEFDEAERRYLLRREQAVSKPRIVVAAADDALLPPLRAPAAGRRHRR